MKKKKGLLALFLAFAMLFTAMPLEFGRQDVQAASTAANVNLLVNPSFEEDLPLLPHVEDQSGNWFYFQDTVQKTQEQPHTGSTAVKLSATNDALEQDVKNLQEGAVYKVSVWAKNTSPSDTTAWLCLKWYGGSEIKLKIDSSEYKQYEASFTYTGDSSGHNTRTAIWVESGGSGTIYVDDFDLSVISDISQISVENGKISAEFKDDYTGTPSKNDFEITGYSSLDPDTMNEIAVTSETVTDRTLEMNFEPIKKAPVSQVITVYATYKPKKQTFTLDYTLDASGEPVIVAQMQSVAAQNGTVEVILDKLPTVLPAKKDFRVDYKIEDGDYQNCEVSEFHFSKTDKKATLKIPELPLSAQSRKITVQVTYNGQSLSSEYILEIGDGRYFYIDSVDGNDENNGMSETTPWQTIEKVNSIVFQPGDHILFKAGCEWTGALKPRGSGVEGAPIVIASYGEGSKPCLKPGSDWTISHMNIASQIVRNPVVNNVISFFNQEYWEVKDLELYDPSYLSNANTSVYRRGINISAEDAGDLHYFKFDNLEIHGFRGPTSNEGKSSGGIIMTVSTNLNDVSKRVPTAIHDISVTNCQLHHLGRSGINFISPWTTREGGKWTKYEAFGYPGLGAWKPYENFTLSNNIIHDIDGDGTIVDGCSNVKVDHNIVYRAVYNCWYGVGLFNWNSDNTVFEYNEVYESSPSDSLLGAGDGQGIEIDALNQNTIVQYNYLHDNAGGTFMWCNTPSLRGFDGIYRYNIMQNDGTGHGVIDWRPGHTGSMAYNNTVFHKDTGKEEKFFADNSGGNPADAKFYNNIFVNEGTMGTLEFKESEIDWERNIFAGYDQTPSNDTTVITEDPKFVAPNTGAAGRDTVQGYKLLPDSPAINAGMEIEDNGGQDYFGTPLTDGKTDIGAAEYAEHKEPETATITVTAEHGGSVSGGGVFEKGSKAALTAIADEGYLFAGWYQDEIKVSDADVYEVVVESDAAYIAKFIKKEIPKPETVTITVQAEEGGSVSGSATVEKGAQVTLKATAAKGYLFAGWYQNGAKVSSAAAYTVTANENAVYTAKFTKQPAVKVDKVTGVKASAQTSSSIKINWKKQSGVKGYEISRYENKKWKTIKTVTGTSYVDKGLTAGKGYSYRVKAYKMDGKQKVYGSFSNTLKTATSPKKVKLKAKVSGKNKVKLSWNKGTKADGFVIYKKTGKGKYVKLTKKSGKAVSYVAKGLKKGKSYTFKIKAFTKNGKVKVYGKSAVSSKIKIK